MNHISWQEHFKNKIKDAENLYIKDSTEVSLLLFCLRAKILSSQEYLEWACEAYQLPILSEKFFTLNTPTAEFFKKYQSSFTWSLECVPVAEWDGALIVACLETPTNFNTSEPAIFVLTSYENLEKVWKSYQQKPKSSADVADMTDMTALAATVVNAKNDKPLFDQNGELILQDDSDDSSEGSPEEVVVEGEEKSESPSEEHESGMPEGFFSDNEAPKPILSATPVSLAPSLKTALDLPEEQTKTGPVEEEMIHHDFPSLPAEEEIPAALSEASGLSVMHEEMLKKGPRTSVPLSAIDTLPSDDDEQVGEPQTDVRSLSSLAPPAVSGNFPSAPVKPTTSQGISAAYFLEKVRKQNQAQFDKEILAGFNQFKTFFKKSMLLAIGDKDRLVKPLMWDGGFDVKKPQISEFDLKTPSIFKIVSGTQKPYHGYVIINDLNESFFESWNHGQIPDHVTIVPLLDGDLVVGMLMGFGEKSNYNKSVLQFSENIARGLSDKLLKPNLSKVA